MTSRYHAQVLATAALVPTVAVSMDERLDNLAVELGLGRDYLLHVEDDHLAERVLIALDDASAAMPAICAQLQVGLDSSRVRLNAMADWLETQLPPIARPKEAVFFGGADDTGLRSVPSLGESLPSR